MSRVQMIIQLLSADFNLKKLWKLWYFNLILPTFVNIMCVYTIAMPTSIGWLWINYRYVIAINLSYLWVIICLLTVKETKQLHLN